MSQNPPPAYPDDQEQGGIQGALSRQIGPLKAWQWGLVIGGAGLLYFYLRGGSGGGGGGSTTTTQVPFTSTGDGLNAQNGVNTALVRVPSIKKTVAYFRATTEKRTPIFNKAGKITGYFKPGRNLILGKRIKINGRWYFTILNMPGKFVRDSWVDQVPVYNEQIEPTSTLTPISVTMGAPIMTPEAVESVVLNTGNALAEAAPRPSGPTMDTSKSNGLSITSPSYTRAGSGS